MKLAHLISCVVLLVPLSLTAQQAKPPVSVANDPAHALRERADRASTSDCAKVCFEAAAHIAEASNEAFTVGNVELGQKWMKDAVEYARKGTKASVQTHKNQKGAEISLRRLSKRIHDIGDSLSLEDRPPVYQEAKTVDGLRDECLTSMFGTPKKTLEEKKKK